MHTFYSRLHAAIIIIALITSTLPAGAAMASSTQVAEDDGLVTASQPQFLQSFSLSTAYAGSLEIGKTYYLDIMPVPSDYSIDGAVVSSSRPDIISAATDGKRIWVIPISVGTAAVTATIEGLNSSITLMVFTDEAVVTSVAIDQTVSQSANVGEQISLSATVLPVNAANKTLIWESQNPSVATVNSNGIVSILGAGTSIITAKASDGSGRYDSIIITGIAPTTVQGVKISASAGTVAVGQSILANAQIVPAGISGMVRWSSSNDNIALSGGGISKPVAGSTGITISSAAQVIITGQAAGTAEIYLEHMDSGKKDAVILSIEVNNTSNALAILTPARTTLNVGERITLSAYKEGVLEGSGETIVSWSSSDSTVASVGASSGEVIGLAEGAVVITASDLQGVLKSASITLLVVAPEKEPDLTLSYVLSETLTVRRSASSSSTALKLSAPLRKGDTVEVLSVSGAWAKILLSQSDAKQNSLADNTAYVAAAYVGQPEQKYVKSGTVTVRENASTSAVKKGTLTFAERIYTIGSPYKGWQGILLNGALAYISSASVADELIGSVTSGTLVMREKPSGEGVLVGNLKKGDKVRLLSKTNGYYSISYNEKTVYIYARYVTIVSK